MPQTTQRQVSFVLWAVAELVGRGQDAREYRNVYLLSRTGCAQPAAKTRPDCADDPGDRLRGGSIDDDVFGIPRPIRRSDSVEVIATVRAANRCMGPGAPRQW